MNKIRRPHPEIHLDKTRSIFDVGRGQFAGIYTVGGGANNIHIAAMPEKFVVATLIHEITHWAQFMYLNDEEIKNVKYETSYSSSFKSWEELDVMEKHAHMVQDDWEKSDHDFRNEGIFMIYSTKPQ
jgi:hypothetical protein